MSKKEGIDHIYFLIYMINSFLGKYIQNKQSNSNRKKGFEI